MTHVMMGFSVMVDVFVIFVVCLVYGEFYVLPQLSRRPTFFSGSMKSRFGSRVGDSESFLDMISYHNFCPDRNTKFPKIPPDRSFVWIGRFLDDVGCYFGIPLVGRNQTHSQHEISLVPRSGSACQWPWILLTHLIHLFIYKNCSRRRHGGINLF